MERRWRTEANRRLAKRLRRQEPHLLTFLHCPDVEATNNRAERALRPNNGRFLILLWVRVKGLASKILALSARHMPHDWQNRYGHRPLLLETLVDASRFHGTCYRTANWICVGQTTGRGRWT